MDGLFNGSAGDRRRFLDRMVLAIDPGHARRTLDYEKSTRSRNRLLADGVRDPRYLDAIEAQIAGTGSAIAVARNECVRLLQAMIEAQEPSNPFPQADVTIEGETEALVATMAAVDAEERFRAELRETRERDRIAGRTLSGPHRSDLMVEHRAKQTPASLCSTGEQKALLIGLILAHARLTSGLTGMTPIMLLDEIGAHLDARRREGLFAILDGLNVQAFMTGTEATLFSALSGQAQFFTINNGEARESA
jgi:DNA replication and repair protein RecF